MSDLFVGKNLITVLVVVNGVFGALGLLSIFPALMSVMMFDAPGSEKNKLLRFTFHGILSFPALGILSIPMTWAVYYFKQGWPALVVSFSPLISIGWIALGFALIAIVHDGQFRPND